MMSHRTRAVDIVDHWMETTESLRIREDLYAEIATAIESAYHRGLEDSAEQIKIVTAERDSLKAEREAWGNEFSAVYLVKRDVYKLMDEAVKQNDRIAELNLENIMLREQIREWEKAEINNFNCCTDNKEKAERYREALDIVATELEPPSIGAFDFETIVWTWQNVARAALGGK